MIDEELNKKLKNKCVNANMCVKGFELWEDDIDDLLELAKKENDFIIGKKPLSHYEIKTLIPDDLLKKHAIFIDNKKVKAKAKNKKHYYAMFLGSEGEYFCDNSNIIVVGDNSNMTLKLSGKGFYSIKVFTNSKVNIVLLDDCRVLVLNHTPHNVKVVKAYADKGLCTIKTLKEL